MTAPGDEENDSPKESSDGLGDISDSYRQVDSERETREKGPNSETGTAQRRADDELTEFGFTDDTADPQQEPTAKHGDPERTVSGPQEQYRHTNTTDDNKPNEWVLLGRDIGISILAVALIGTYLFAISGVWPPMVAIESGSMEPNMNENDLVFVMEVDRFQPAAAEESGIVSAAEGDEHDYTKFGASGDVIVYAPNGNTEQTPIIHRAMLWVEEGDDWVEQADEAHLGSVDSCEDVASVCPAPNDGFITKGDNERTNQVYDQVNGERPVHPEWVMGTAEVRVPGLGWLRLQFE